MQITNPGLSNVNKQPPCPPWKALAGLKVHISRYAIVSYKTEAAIIANGRTIPDIWRNGAFERSENIAHVVFRFDAGLEQRIPVLDDIVNDRSAGDVDVLQGFDETSLVHVEELLGGGLPWRWSIEIGRGTHGDDTAEIDTIVQRTPEEGFHDGIVFLRGGAISPSAIGEQRNIIAKRFAK